MRILTRSLPYTIVVSLTITTTTSFLIPRQSFGMDRTVLSAKVANKGDVIKAYIDLVPNGGFVAEPLFDTNGSVMFQLGGGGHLPGLDDLITGMEEGSVVENVDIDAGWGAKNLDAMATIPLDTVDESIRTNLKLGVELFLQGGQKVRVTEISDDTFTIDANHPMAGATYKCNKVQLEEIIDPERLETMTVALGCFWGGELAYMREPGVVSTKVGYTQGQKIDPTYKEVCSGTTGHTEAIQVVFDPVKVSFERLVQLGMERLGESKYLLNQVGNDRGTQYRHGIYYHSDSQREVAEKVLSEIAPKANGTPCQTELKEATIFYDAEDYHQQYLLKGGQSAKKGASETIRCYG